MFRYEINRTVIMEYVHSFLSIATLMIGEQINQTNGKFVFNQIYGVTPIICGVTWYLLKNNVDLRNDIEKVHLLWALYFMKNYVKEEVLRPIFNNHDKKIIRDKMWYIIEKISCLSSIVVSIYMSKYFININM
jgi:hypothetical protein